MPDDVLPLLKVHAYFRGLEDDLLRAIAAAARVNHHAPGEVVHEADCVPSTVRFVLRGRLKAVRIDAQGREWFFRMFERGDQLGMMAGALAEPIPVRVVALEPTTLFTFEYEQAMELTLVYPELRRLWLKSYAARLRSEYFGTAPRPTVKVLGIVHQSESSREAARRLVRRLVEVGENLAVFSDRDDLRSVQGLRFGSLVEQGRRLTPSEIRDRASAWQDADRLVFDLDHTWDSLHLNQLLGVANRVLVFVPETQTAAAVAWLKQVGASAQGWRDKLALVWLLDGQGDLAPAVPGLDELVAQDFKVALNPLGPTWGKALAQGLERIVHDLRGVRIGVALGGGAARGMSHLGVLRALEESGLVIDMLAGTSAGAMTGTVYASGLDARYAAQCFARDLRPGWIFRHFPHGSHWYLLYKFRRGQFDPMLRKYLRDWRLEQLPIPCRSITVDLVSGSSVVRHAGDAVHAVLESINLPVLSVPICRDGQALVDGGLVKNIPADVLVSQGCNFVIAVSVTARMEHEFCQIRPGAAAPQLPRPTMVQTLLRSLLVQNHNLNAIGVQPAEVVIEPDVTGFDLTEFSRAESLAEIGHQTALQQVPRIRQLLHRLDPKLFPIVANPGPPA